MKKQEAVSAFFAYPSRKPGLAEAIRAAVPVLNGGGLVAVKTWEQCKIGGKVVVQEICREIDEASLFMADVTGLNANVMFELGYAIARNKRIWLVLDSSYQLQQEYFKRLRLLTTVGYADCTNSEHIHHAFFRDQPTEDLERTIYRQAIEPSLQPGDRKTLLYLKSRHENQASIAMHRILTSSACHLVIDDPLESATQTLTWYGVQTFNSLGVACHLVDPQREGMHLEAAKYALVAGMAHGFNSRVILLAEGDFLAPIDYRDLLQSYSDAESARARLTEWLEGVEASFTAEERKKAGASTELHLATELQSLRFGHHVAENESEDLVGRYFVETAAYRAALSGDISIFIGRKGSGKTANLLKLEAELKQDKRTLVCVIKPVAYEMQGIVDLLAGYMRRDTKGYAIESLWKLLLLTEVARTLYRHLKDRIPIQAYDRSDEDFIHFVESHERHILPDFSTRLESTVEALTQSGGESSSTERTRQAISEALHQSLIGELREKLALSLGRVSRVAILMDNLDKTWDRTMDLEVITPVLLGLLGPAGKMDSEIRKINRTLDLRVTLAVFLRADIFDRIRSAAREPDKLRVHQLRWSDRELLARVVEERFAASREEETNPDALWSFFCPTIDAMSPKDYVLSRILERPRDLILFVSGAVAAAVNRRHTRVEVADIREAERQYSEYALDSLVVESTELEIDLETVLFEFAGARAVLGESEVRRRLEEGGVEPDRVDRLIEDLCRLTFLGVEVGQGSFRYAPDEKQRRRNAVQARQYAASARGEQRYEIHPAFRSFLEVEPAS